jgi:hypothetical protein
MTEKLPYVTGHDDLRPPDKKPSPACGGRAFGRGPVAAGPGFDSLNFRAHLQGDFALAWR